MSSELTQETNLFAEKANVLMREYTQKLIQLEKELSEEAVAAKLAKSQDDDCAFWFHYQNFDAYSGYLMDIISGTQKLSRQISQNLEHTELESSVRMELEMRLREFESQQTRVNQVQSSSHRLIKP